MPNVPGPSMQAKVLTVSDGVVAATRTAVSALPEAAP